MTKLICDNNNKHTEYLSSIVDQSIFCVNQFAGPEYIEPQMKFCPYCGYALNQHEEPEDALLVNSGILPYLIKLAQQESSSLDWEQVLDEC